MDVCINKLPDDFIFGVATAAYQIEGTSFGGCGRSHWDDFADQPGAVANGENGRIACDHYHLWESDLDLIKNAGFDAYRFSFSWPRLLPEDDTTLNQEGIEFYDRLIDGMLARGLKPFATLYHWDLPSRHASEGGWQCRETAQFFADYTDVIMRHFGDRLYSVAPLNEPWCVSWLSHYWGQHAPGIRSLSATAKAMHMVQLAHGLSIEVMRGHGHKNLGCVLNKEYAVPGDDTEKTAALTALYDAIYNRWFEDSVFKARYPQEVLDVFGEHMPRGYEDDLKLISQPLDWVGMNYYTRSVIVPDDEEPHIGFACTGGDLPRTDMGWEIVPEGLSFFLRRLADDYAPGLPLYVTENGMANNDRLSEGKVDDPERIAYYSDHLNEIAALAEEGVKVAGYFAWSLLDNYEWAYGYDKRFGLVHVDYDTMHRTPKTSYHEWQNMLEGR
jgi:beta-glucosidase